MQPALSGSLLQWGRVSDPTAALSGSQIKATGFAGGYLLTAAFAGAKACNEFAPSHLQSSSVKIGAVTNH
jgi:hypothetical protein